MLTSSFVRASVGVVALVAAGALVAPAAARAEMTGGWSGTFFDGGVWHEAETFVHWDDAEHAEESDDAHASAWLGDGPTHMETKPLIVGAFGFEIPEDATIDGIELIVERSMLAPEGLGFAAVRDASIRLLKDWDAAGDEKADASLDWTPYDETVTYGGPSDLWGLSWTPAEVNAGGFGALLMAWRTASGIENQRMAQVDEIMVNVYYTLAQGGGDEEEPADACPDMDGVQADSSECTPDGNEGEEEDPADLCTNIEGIQDSVPEGMTAADGICSAAQEGGEGGDGSEVSSSSENDGNGGGGSRRHPSERKKTDPASVSAEGEVLGICAPYLTSYIKPGAANDTTQVRKLQEFLRAYAGETDLAASGEYDEATVAAVRRFQAAHPGDILAPWGTSVPTGYVYYTTQKKINEIVCGDVVLFPLSEAQRAEIAATRARYAALAAGITEEDETVVRAVEADAAPTAPGWLGSLMAAARESLARMFGNR